MSFKKNLGGRVLFLLFVTQFVAAPTTVCAEEREESSAPQETKVNDVSLITKPPPLIAVKQLEQKTRLTMSKPFTTETELPDYLKNCFYSNPDLCQKFYHKNDNATGTLSLQHDTNTCHCREHPHNVNYFYCCNITHMSMISSCGNNNNWTNLHINNMSLTELNLSNSLYQNLHSLAITDGNISRVVNSFSRVSPLKCLNISNNHIANISMRALSSVPTLKYLDISKNNLTRIPNWNQNQNITVNVRGNMYMLCESLHSAILHEAFHFVDPETSFCLHNSTYNWFNTTDSVSIKQVETSARFKTECPVIPGFGNCSCTQGQLIAMGDQSTVFCNVDCSNMGLTELPPKLPQNTFILNITNNNISNIGKHFHNNPTYKDIVKLYADNNQISSLFELEGTAFMDHFQRLSLKNNALSRLPVYFLSNVLRVTDRRIFLGGNKLECDCNSAKILKVWLNENYLEIPDYNEVVCRNLPLRVMDLQEIKLCQSPHDWTDYIYYLIATEVILLFALITKVSYDYWVFKTAGYLPWPASKMPKLPCDWLCES